MSEVEYLSILLENNWHESVTGRPNNVPTPEFVETTENIKKRLRTKDVVYITAAGPTNIEPKGFQEAGYTANMQIDIRAKTRNIDSDSVYEDAYKRMFGSRTSIGNMELGSGLLGSGNESVRWPGLAGETLRILMDKWRGDREFDLVTPPEINDNSHQTGPNSARATIDVELERIAWDFDTSV